MNTSRLLMLGGRKTSPANGPMSAPIGGRRREVAVASRGYTGEMAQKHDVIDSTFLIKTPENIGFRYGVAGPFRRFPAFCIDLACMALFFIALVFLAALFARFSLEGPIMLIGMFVLQWFYGGLFEAYMNGQTPGKWLLGLRTVSVDGKPINGMQAILRNLLRGVDLFVYPHPQFFVLAPIGLVASAMNARFQRLGDLAAGTMVIIEETPWLTGMAKLDDPRTIQLAGYIPPEFTVNKTMAKAIATYVERRRFFSLPRRREMTKNLAAPLLDQFGLPADTSYDLLLCALYYRTFVADRGDDEKNLAAARSSNPFEMLRPTH